MTEVGGGLVDYDLLPGRTTAHEVLGLNGEAGEVRGGAARSGAGTTAEEWCDQLALDRMPRRASRHRMAVAAVDGDTSSSRRERSDGQDAGRMLLDELLPFLSDRGCTSRRAVWSAGLWAAWARLLPSQLDWLAASFSPG